MKLIVSFCFVIASFLAFGQSAKKMNKKLLADFASEQQKQDSAFIIFTQTKREFDSIKKLTNDKINDLSDQERTLKRQSQKVSEVLSKLKELGVNTDLIVSDPSKKYGFPGYRDLVRPIKVTLKKEVNFDKVSNRLYLDMYKLKEQNVMLTEKVKEYRDYSQHNSIQQQDLESNRDEMISFLPKLDSLLTVYESDAKELGAKWPKVMDKLDELRGNYMEKGPDGFPEAYKRVFYDVFPPKQEEMIRDVEISHVELADGPYERVPPPVEEKRHEKEDVLSIIEEPGSFPGGVEAMKTFITKNLRYPEKMKEAAVQGKVYLKFIVSETGEISDVKIVRGLSGCPECDEEAIRVVKMMPKWIPGKNNGKAVKSYYNLPVNFKLN